MKSQTAYQKKCIAAFIAHFTLLLCLSITSTSSLSLTDTPRQNPVQVQKKESLTFTLKKIELQGNTLFSAEELKSLYSQKFNHEVSFIELEEITKTITRKYRNAGYVLSRAVLPAQTITDGVVHIQIFEGNISNLSIETNAKCPNRLLNAYGLRIIEDKPLHLDTLERYTLLANDLPGVNIRSVLEPSCSTAGSSTLTFTGTEKTFDGILGGDNRGSSYTGKEEIFFSGNANSLFRSGDTTGMQLLTTSKKNGMYFANLNHQQPVGSNGTEFKISQSYIHSNPGLIVTPLNILGKAYIFSSQFLHRFIRTTNQNLSAFLTLEIIRNNTDILKTKLFRDRITALRLGFIYEVFDNFYGFNSAEIRLSKGLLMFGASHKNNPNLSRKNGSSDYTKIVFELSRTQYLPCQFSFVAALRGQYAFDPLLAAEQFTYGGAIYGRGYNPSIISGDDGLAGKFELRYTQTNGFNFLKTKRFDMKFDMIEYYIFSDFGIAWKPLPILHKRYEDGASIGAGIRTNLGNLYAYTELAKPLVPVATNSETQGTNFRLFFGILYKF